MKAIGFLVGQVGDLVMCTVAARQFKRENPSAHLTFAIGNKYGHVKDLFVGNPYIDAVHVWDSYDGWPSAKDTAFIRQNGFQIIFNPLPPHSSNDWYNHLHYTEETCAMLGLKCPSNLQCELGYKPKKIEGLEKTITTSMYASGNQPYKTLNQTKINDLFDRLSTMGYDIIQVGSSDLPNAFANHLNIDIYKAIDTICSARLHLTIDTAFSWISSAYKRPLVGLYGINYLDMPLSRVGTSHNPINSNATYLNADKVDNITVDSIIEAIKIYG